jgi:hypothetical protein
MNIFFFPESQKIDVVLLVQFCRVLCKKRIQMWKAYGRRRTSVMAISHVSTLSSNNLNINWLVSFALKCSNQNMKLEFSILWRNVYYSFLPFANYSSDSLHIMYNIWWIPMNKFQENFNQSQTWLLIWTCVDMHNLIAYICSSKTKGSHDGIQFFNK